MTKRKPKISYRDLLAQREPAEGGVAPITLTPEKSALPTPAPDAPASATSAVAAPTPVAPASEPSAVATPAPAAADTPAPIATRSDTPLSLAAVLNAPRRLTPIGSALVPPAPAGAPPSITTSRRTPVSAPRIAARPTRRMTRATVAGRIALDSAIRTDLAAFGKAELLRFRVGPERFALRLADVEEAVEAPVLHPLPDLPRHVLGVLAMRGRLVPVHAPAHVLGVGIGSLGVALVLSGDPPLALAVDDVEDVFTIEPRVLRDAPGVDDPDGVLVGVTRHNGKLVGVLDAPALALACLAPAAPESRR